MARQRILTIPQSLRVAKLWYQLLVVRGGRVYWDFWTLNEAAFVQLCEDANLQELMDFPQPYTRSLASLKIFLKCMTTYLSRGYFEGDLNNWLANPIIPVVPQDGGQAQPPGGGLQAERDALVAATPNCEGSTVTAMTSRAREVLEVIDYQKEKIKLGENVVERYNKFLPLNIEIEGLRNQVIRQETTKAGALEKVNKVLEEMDLLFIALKAFYEKEPSEGAYEGCLLAIGEAFIEQVDQAALDALIIEATNRDRALLMRASANIHNIRDVPPISDRYEALLVEYQEINALRTDREDQGKDVERRMKQFLVELNSLKAEINSTEDEDLVVLVLKDYLDQVSELKKKLGYIRALTNEELITPNITQEEEDRDEVTFLATYTVDEWLSKTRRKLLLMKESQEKENRKKENQEKILLQETLKIASKTTIRDLDSRRVFLPWHEDYQKTKASFKKTNLPDWRDSVLRVAKKSLKRPADIEACMFVNNLGEFEGYISSEFIVGVNMLNDLFSKLFSMTKADNIQESIARITEAMNVIRTVKARSLWIKFNETHLDKIVKICLLRRDGNEFESEWAKKRSRDILASEAARPIMEDDDEVGMDMNKTISEEIHKGTLEEKKTFIVEFLRTKLLELGSKQASARNIEGENQVEKRERKTLKIRRGDKVFRVTETNGDESSSDTDNDLAEGLEAVLALRNEDLQTNSRKKTKLPQKKCPLRCDRKFHSNGSAYFCTIFRNKDMEEKKELVKKLPLCILCLIKGTKTHECPVGKCAKCSGHHNILLCPKKEEESILKVTETYDGPSSDSEDDEQEDYTSNKEVIAVVKGGEKRNNKTKDPDNNTKGTSKDGESDKDVDKKTSEEKMSKLKGVLKTVAKGHETGKRISFNEGPSKKQTEKILFIRGSSMDGKGETDDDFSSEKDNESNSERELEEDSPSWESRKYDSLHSQSGEDSINSDETESTEVSSDDTGLNDNEESESDESHSYEQTDTETDTEEPTSEKCLLISSAANMRRRELQGQSGYFKEEGDENKEAHNMRKKKLVKKRQLRKEKMANLEEMKTKIKDTTTKDTRGLKRRNPKRAVASVEKWETSGLWSEIVLEGEETSSKFVEAVRLLHIPHTAPSGLKDPEPPPGFKRVKFDARRGGKIFNLLLNFSTQLFQEVLKCGKNLSSLTSEVTLLANECEVDHRKAALHKVKVTNISGQTLVQTHAICDTGAEPNCTDKTLRRIIGRDEMPNAAVGLQGATGTNDDKCKDKLRIVTKDKEVNVLEARSIEDLGYSGPNSPQFLDCVKTEIGINEKNKKHFDFNEKGSAPRVLVGLKSGSLLAEKISEQQTAELQLRTPFLSPNLQVWSTPLNSKLLITGSLGVDPLLVEPANNYPRFSFMVKENENEEDIEELLNVEVCQLEKNLGVKFEKGEEKCFPLTVDREQTKEKHFPPTPKTKDENTKEGMNKSEEIFWSDEDELPCWDNDHLRQNHSPPPRIICSTDRIYLTKEELLILPEDVDGENKEEEEEKVYYSKTDSLKLQKFLLEEQNHIWKKPRQQCNLHAQKCEVCDLLSRRNSNRENELVQRTWDAVTAKEVEPGRHIITNNYQYRHDTSQTYEPAKSNIEEAQGHAKRVVRRAHRQGSLHLLDEQVNKMITKNCFKEMSTEEILALEDTPHHFTYYNWVNNPNSSSTPFRMITNTSSVSSCTTISTEQLSPSNVLNPQENGIIRFCLYPVPLCADIAGAYHTIDVDEASSMLRLFFYFWDPPECHQPRLFRQTSQAFGDTSAAQGMEVSILKFVVVVAVLIITKFILEEIRYSDNLMFSFETIEEFEAVKKDLTKSFETYSMNLKYCITSQEHDPDILNHPARGPETVEKTLGLLWSVVDDTLTATPRYNLFGNSRGKPLGPPLREMTDEQVAEMKITRMTFLRLSAQTYDKLANILGPLMFSCKVISSRACELASVDELEEDLSLRDPEFVAFCKGFIMNLRKVDQIVPLSRCWVPKGYILLGFIISLDGGKSGYGAIIHAIAMKLISESSSGTPKKEKNEEIKLEEKITEESPHESTPEDRSEDEVLLRSLAMTRSKIAKRNIVAHEVSAGKLGGEALRCLLQPLAFDFWNVELLLPFKTDSTCFLAMLNPQIEMRNMLLMNAVAAFKEELIRISLTFPRARITVGHTAGATNPADCLTKLYKDPVACINSTLYRFGPQKYGDREALEEDIVATCAEGSFTFSGLPKKFLTENTEQKERCNVCREPYQHCAIVKTRARTKKEDDEDSMQVEELKQSTIAEVQRKYPLISAWGKRIKGALRIREGNNLLDHNYEAKLGSTLSKETYTKWTSKFPNIEQLFRAAALLACLSTKGKQGVDIKKEAWMLILRSSQKHFNQELRSYSDTVVRCIKVLELRLESSTARSLFGTKYIPVLGTDDPLRTQLMRRAHEMHSGASREIHHLEKTTIANLVSGQVGVTWKNEKKEIKSYISRCGVCLKFRKEKCAPPLGKSLFRVRACKRPFEHVSADPLGAIRVREKMAQTHKIYPLIIACLQTGGTHVELMSGMEARDIYLSMLRLQYRYNTVVTQIFSDGGSNLKAKLLGSKKNYYQDKLERIWGVFNNTPYAQHRNLVERKVSMLKRMIKEGVFGLPGQQVEAIDRTMLETTILAATSMANNIPFMECGPNKHLLGPADFLTPWRSTQPEVHDLPDSGLRTLLEAKRAMTIRQEKLKDLAIEEIRNSKNRFKSGRIKLGKTRKTPPSIETGGVVMIELQSGLPQLGVVIACSARDVSVRHPDGRVVSLPMGQCVPVTPGVAMANRRDESFTHFVSLEVKDCDSLENFKEKAKEMQETLEQVPLIGKPAKMNSFHVTMGTLRIHEVELEAVTRMIGTAVECYVNMLNSSDGVILSFKGVGFGDEAVWTKMNLGASSVQVLRELLEDEVDPYLTDGRFQPHITVYRKCVSDEETRRNVEAAVQEMKLGCVLADRVTLRERKNGPEIKEPIQTWSLRKTNH